MTAVEGLSFLHPGAATGFDDVSFVVPMGATTALIGDNGVGKTTLLRILAGELPPDDGRVTVTGTVRRMPQEVGVADTSATLRELLGSFAPAPLDELSRRIVAAERALEAGDAAAGVELGELLARWGDLGGYELEAAWDVAARSIVGEGIDAVGGRPAVTFSGGALVDLRGAVVAVSHDRAFLRSFDRFLHVGEDGAVHAIADADTAIEVLVAGLEVAGRADRKRLTV